MQSILRRDAAATFVFFVLTLVMTNPLALHIASAVEDKQDALLNSWIIAWVGHALITDPLNLFSSNIFYPYSDTLAFSETMLPQGIFALPFNLAFDNTLLGYNLVLLASFFLAAYGMYLFVLDLTRHRDAAMIAGTIFAFNPYNLGNLAQVQLLSFGWLPLAMMYLKRVLKNPKSQTPNPKTAPRILNLEFPWHRPPGQVRNCFLFALFFSLQALASFYYAFLAGIAVVLYIIWYLIANRFAISLPSPRFLAPQLFGLAVSFVLIALCVTPFFLPYLQVQRDLGFERKVEESEPFSASLNLYTEVSPQNMLYGNWLAPHPPIYNGGYPLDNLFPGFIALGLAIIAIAANKNRTRWFYFCLLAFAFLLSLGPRLYVTPTQATTLTLPYRWLYDVLPLARALRAPVRFDALVMFAVAVLAGVASGGWRVAGRRFRILSFEFGIWDLLVPLIALEYLALPAAQIAQVPVGDSIPEYVRWLGKQPQGVVLELPMIASDPSKPLDLTAQYLSTYHWHPTPDGYSGFIPPKRGEIAYEMQFFPGERTLRLLQVLDVSYVIVHADQISNWDLRRPNIPGARELELAQQFGSDYVFRVARATRVAPLLGARLYAPEPALPGRPYTAFLIIENRDRKSVAVKPTDNLKVNYTWANSQPNPLKEEGATIANLPLVTSLVSVVPIRLNAPRLEGNYRLDLRVTGQGIVWNLDSNIAVRNEEPAHQVVIPASVALLAPLKSEYARGDSLAVDVVWLPLNKVDAYYSASVRIVNARREKIIAQDREPRIATFLWTPIVPVDDHFTLTLPRDIAPGEYSVQLLMYQAEQGAEVLLLDEKFNPQPTIILGTFVVK